MTNTKVNYEGIELKLKDDYENKAKFIDELTKDEFDLELLKGINDIEKGNVKTALEVDNILKEKLGI